MESGDTTPYDRGHDSFEPEFDFRKNELSQIIERALKKIEDWPILLEFHHLSPERGPQDRGHESFELEFDFRKNVLSQIIEGALKKLIFLRYSKKFQYEN